MNFLQKALHPLALKILGGEGNGRQPNAIYPSEFQKDAKGIYAHYLQSQISGASHRRSRRACSGGSTTRWP